MESFSKFVSIIILVICLFLIPLMQVSTQMDNITQSNVTHIVVNFVENVEKQGRITQNMYDKFLEDLGNTGNTYDIEMLHSHTIVNPTFDVNGSISTTTYEDNYYTNDILSTLYGGNADNTMTVETGKVTGEYRMYKGDYFTITVKNKNITTATRFRNFLYRNEFPSCTIYVTYGGEIEDENY